MTGLFWALALVLFFCAGLLIGKKKKSCYALIERGAQTGSFMFVLEGKMRKISMRVAYFFVSVVGLTPELVEAAVDGLPVLLSSDPSVLQVETQADGLFKIIVVGPGSAQLIAKGDADLGDGVKSIESAFDYTVYDQGAEADHFELTTTGFVYRDELADAGEAGAEQAA